MRYVSVRVSPSTLAKIVMVSLLNSRTTRITEQVPMYETLQNGAQRWGCSLMPGYMKIALKWH